MSHAFTLRRTLSAPEDTIAAAQIIGAHLQAADTLLLSGEIGAGKTFFARALIQSRLPEPEDVPSPSFTLVQTYDLGCVELWHVDLYRLSSPDEAFDLGLDQAFDDAICLVEWPERLGSETPPNAPLLQFRVTGEDSRTATVHFADPNHRLIASFQAAGFA